MDSTVVETSQREIWVTRTNTIMELLHNYFKQVLRVATLMLN